MSDMSNVDKILLIISNELNKYFKQKFDLSSKSGYLDFSDYIVEYIVDPSRQELEKNR